MNSQLSVRDELSAMFDYRKEVTIAVNGQGGSLALGWGDPDVPGVPGMYALYLYEYRGDQKIMLAMWFVAISDRFTPEVMLNIFEVLDCVHVLGRQAGYTLCSPFL